MPVVGPASGEIPWVISSIGGGLIFPEGDARALRDALLRLRASPQLRRELAARGGEQARAKFGVDAVARELNLAVRSSDPAARDLHGQLCVEGQISLGHRLPRELPCGCARLEPSGPPARDQRAAH